MLSALHPPGDMEVDQLDMGSNLFVANGLLADSGAAQEGICECGHITRQICILKVALSQGDAAPANVSSNAEAKCGNWLRENAFLSNGLLEDTHDPDVLENTSRGSGTLDSLRKDSCFSRENRSPYEENGETGGGGLKSLMSRLENGTSLESTGLLDGSGISDTADEASARSQGARNPCLILSYVAKLRYVCRRLGNAVLEPDPVSERPRQERTEGTANIKAVSFFQLHHCGDVRRQDDHLQKEGESEIANCEVLVLSPYRQSNVNPSLQVVERQQFGNLLERPIHKLKDQLSEITIARFMDAYVPPEVSSSLY